tara:strand:+ start:159 stop:1040 length:882 start_codon:yes stop_codon:yes gene_type:complete
MEISYKTILEYLSPETTCKNNYPANKGDMVSSNFFPNKFKLLFQDENNFFRYGIYNKKNMSFFSSILTLLDDKFLTFDDEEVFNYCEKFIHEIRTKIFEKGFKFEFKNKFSKDILRDRADSLKLDDGILIQLIVQILSINIIIFNFEDEKIYTLFEGDFMDPWKNTLLLALKDNIWEPIFSDKKKFSFNDSILKNILTQNEILYFNEENFNKSYSLLDRPIENINDNKNFFNKIIESDSEEDHLQTIKNMKLNKTKIRNMKREDIYDILSKVNKDVNENDTKKSMSEKLYEFI